MNISVWGNSKIMNKEKIVLKAISIGQSPVDLDRSERRSMCHRISLARLGNRGTAPALGPSDWTRMEMSKRPVGDKW